MKISEPVALVANTIMIANVQRALIKTKNLTRLNTFRRVFDFIQS